MNISQIQTALTNLVWFGDSTLEQKSLRLTSFCNLFFENFGDGPVSLLRAPARINVLGEHIDYVSYLPTASLTFGSRERDALMLYRHQRTACQRLHSTKYGLRRSGLDTPKFKVWRKRRGRYYPPF